MNTSRKIVSGLIAIIVTIAVFLLGVSLALTNALSSATPVKEALTKSGIYEDFVGEAVDDIPGSIEALIRFEPPMRKVIVEAAIPSMQEDTEAGVDSLLAWVQGSNKEIDFTIAAAGAQESVSKAVGDYTQEMIEDLDECTSLPAGFNVNNPFTWECRLPNTDAASYNTAFYELVKGSDFWAETTYDLKDVLGMSEQELNDEFGYLTAIYPSAMATAWISGIVIVLGAVAMWFLSKSVRRTLRSSGVAFIVGGVLIIATYIVGVVGMGIAAEEFGSSDPVEAISADLIAGLGGVATGWLLWTGIVAVVVGVAAIIASFFVEKGAKTTPPTTNDTLGTPPTETPSTPQTPQGPMPPTSMQ